MLPVTGAIRRRIGAAVLERVVAPRAPRQAGQPTSRIPESERWFSADRPIRQVHNDCAMFVGGMTAILLQSLHPLVAAAVAEHSGYRSDPWGRLQTTSHFVAVTTFGRPAAARAAIAQVRAVHEHITGTAPDGRPYAASDPHLLTWVHVAEITAFLGAYTAYGGESLDQARRDGYVADMARIAAELGVPDPPTTEAQVVATVARYRPELKGTPQAREAALFLLFKPSLPLIIRPIYGALAASAVCLLPRWARRELSLPSLPVAEAVLIRPAGRLAVNAIQWGLSAPVSAAGLPQRQCGNDLARDGMKHSPKRAQIMQREASGMSSPFGDKPYGEKKKAVVHGRRMAYVEQGTGSPIVFQHGNPTSSYLWRNIMPHLEGLGRLIACDLTGMGDSDKLDEPGPDRYTYEEQREYLFALWEHLGVDHDVVLVIHDWGSVLGFDWANQHRGQVAGIAYMEAIVTPFTWDDLAKPEPSRREAFEGLRSPAGEKMVLEDNFFVENRIPNGILRKLSPEEMATYVRPFANPGEDRRPTLTFPRQLPIDGQPANVVEIVSDYGKWLAHSDVPKLFINAEPGGLLTGRPREFCRTWPSQTEVTVAGKHFVQEDSPDQIGEAIRAFVAGLR